ncbi:MAG: hypothetical protein SFU98_11720 [Leptospiraceae bacterium]|nr:hypothetical protein [Leptospiraceae bacterium]
MKTIETIATIGENGEVTIPLDAVVGSSRDFSLIPGKHKVVLVIEEELYEEEVPLSEEEKEYLKQALKEIEEKPESGHSWDEVLTELEARVGRKIRFPRKSEAAA